MDKKNFREIYINKRNSISYDEIVYKSNIIMDKILKSDIYEKAESIFIYVNMGSEIVTKDFIKYALNDGKKIAVPVIGKEKGQMLFIEIEGLDCLVPKKYGISEPEFNEKKILECTESTLVVVPLLAFNKEKYRIGYGGGFYDRFMSKNKALKYAGAAMEWQLTDNLPVESHDLKLDVIYTEKNIY